MQDVEGFRKYLRRKGKKDHVVDGLIERCTVFEEFLLKKRKTSIVNADKEDILAFLELIKDQKADVNNLLRAIGLYYRFASRSELSTFASNLRGHRISSVKKPFALKDFRGVSSKYVAVLANKGITNADQMLEIGKTPASRQELSDGTGVPIKAILELVKLSDLSRIEGVKSIRARLYYDAGVDTLEKMTKWKPEELRLHMIEFVQRTGFKGIPPLPKEVKFTIETAKKLPKLVEH
jgi:predicted flap endonuclease-1-like 5' DNA nuclease